MKSLLSYELKKILTRPFTFIVCLGCVAITAFLPLYSASQASAYVIDAAAAQQESAEPASQEKGQVVVSVPGEDTPGTSAISFGEEQLPDGVRRLTGSAAIEQEKEYIRSFEGPWDNGRLQQMVSDYQAYESNPDIYSDELDEWAMQSRAWALSSEMSEKELAAYEAANPIYRVKPEYQYGEGQKWSFLSTLLEQYVINPDGSAKSFEEAFPLAEEKAVFEYHNGPQIAGQMQGLMIGLMTLLMVVAGIAPVFSDEVTNRTEPMLLAAKYGRDKLIRAKILSGFIFAVLSLAALTVINILMSGAAYGFSGWQTPLQFDAFTYSMPFAFTYQEYLLAIFGFQVLGVCSMAALVMLLSALFRSAIPVVFAGGLFAVFLTMLVNAATGFWAYLSQTLPPGAASPIPLLYDGMEKGWGVLPVPQWMLAIIVCSVILIASLAMIIRKYRRLSKV